MAVALVGGIRAPLGTLSSSIYNGLSEALINSQLPWNNTKVSLIWWPHSIRVNWICTQEIVNFLSTHFHDICCASEQLLLIACIGNDSIKVLNYKYRVAWFVWKFNCCFTHCRQQMWQLPLLSPCFCTWYDKLHKPLQVSDKQMTYCLPVENRLLLTVDWCSNLDCMQKCKMLYS